MYNVITAEITVNYLCRKCKETYNTARTKKKVDFAGLEVQDQCLKINYIWEVKY